MNIENVMTNFKVSKFEENRSLSMIVNVYENGSAKHELLKEKNHLLILNKLK